VADRTVIRNMANEIEQILKARTVFPLTMDTDP
jgi:hypothetical protein